MDLLRIERSSNCDSTSHFLSTYHLSCISKFFFCGVGFVHYYVFYVFDNHGVIQRLINVFDWVNMYYAFGSIRFQEGLIGLEKG